MEPPSFNIPAQKPPQASHDEKAESEAAAFAFNLDLSSAETNRKIKRLGEAQATESLIGWLLRTLLVISFIIIAVSVLILAYHYLAPTKLLYLEEDRVDNLKEILFSGGVGAGFAQLSRAKLFQDPD